MHVSGDLPFVDSRLRQLFSHPVNPKQPPPSPARGDLALSVTLRVRAGLVSVPSSDIPTFSAAETCNRFLNKSSTCRNVNSEKHPELQEKGELAKRAGVKVKKLVLNYRQQ